MVYNLKHTHGVAVNYMQVSRQAWG